MQSNRKRWDVFTILSKPGLEKPYWMKLGVAFVNHDGSLNLYLDAMPLDGKLQLREARESREGLRSASNGAGAEVPEA